MKNLLFSLLFASAFSHAQDAEYVKKVAEEACPCTHKISTEQKREKIVEEINSCITQKILMSQLMSTLNQTEIEGAIEEAKKTGDSTTTVNKNIIIVADKGFEQIQAYMFENCEAVKYLLSSNNDLHEKSLSKNKKALDFYREGQTYSQQEKFEMAIVSYNKAVKADPKFTFAWDNLGMSYRRIGNYKEAIKCYQKSLDIEPKGKMPLQNMGVAYEYLKDYNRAAETYEKFIKQYPDDPEGFYGAARTFYIIENYEKGVDYMFKAYLLYNEQKSPYVNDALTNLKQFYNELKEKNKLDIFMKAAEKNKITINDNKE